MRFSEICPVWFQRMKNYDELNRNTRILIKSNLKEEARCIVGEAWGWSEVYAHVDLKEFCKECRYLGICFYYCINGEQFELDKELYRKKIKSFLRHIMIHRESPLQEKKRRLGKYKNNRVKKISRRRSSSRRVLHA